MPSAIVALNKAIYGDHFFESCRLAALLMIEAIDADTPFVNLKTSLVSRLKTAMQKNRYWKLLGIYIGRPVLDCDGWMRSSLRKA
jgi:hypothetical protein